jgi:ribulose-5-phosphate 4-epimerase/fuculose-1-phosphate aldolase
LLRNEVPEYLRPEVASLVQSHPTVQYFDSDAWVIDQAEIRGSKSAHPLEPPYRQSDRVIIRKENRVHTTQTETYPPPQAERLDSAPCRWVSVQLEKNSVAEEIPSSMFQAIRELGQLIGGVEGQLDSAGNISFLHEENIFVTTTGAFIRELMEEDFVKILSLRENTLACKGLAYPSTESLMHYLVYEATDAQVVVHFHHIPDSRFLPQDVAVTGPHEYGSRALAEGVAASISAAPIVYIRSHGFVVSGTSTSRCRTALVRLFSSILNFEKCQTVTKL